MLGQELISYSVAMLRNLRSRRRPRYGAQLCALVCAFLLLLSVSLLHTRLSISSKPHIFRQTNDLVLPSKPLLSDSDEDSGVGSSDDKIDELDIIEENDRLPNEDDAEQDQQEAAETSAGHFYFDHVSGVIRRTHNKRSIEEWDFDYLGFNDVFPGNGGSEAKIKEALASDDIPVDEEIRKQMAEVVGVEDVLLLKAGKRVSPLREKWGDWFDKKGDFLKKDRMFRSNMEILNPLNNPLLQDPDGAGGTGLTRGDKALQKWILSEFKRVPFTAKKRLEATDSFSETRSKSKMPERRALDENSRNRDQTKSKSSGVKNLSSTPSGEGESSTISSNGLDSEKVNDVTESLSNERSNKGSASNLKIVDSESHQSRNELSGHIYADGKRWGYYPQLDPMLSFSEFMDAFFLKGKCDMRVFMIWNSPPWMFSVKHQRGLESLLAQHRDACIVLFSETVDLDFFKDSFVKDGFKVAVAMPNLDELLNGTLTHAFSSISFKWRKTDFYSTHYSELVRLAALYKYGGTYLDFDVIVLKPLSSLNNSVGLEDKFSGSSLNGAVMAFRRHSAFLMECLKEFYLTYDDTRLRWNGADLLTRVARKFYSGELKPIMQLELNVQPFFMFFPISSQHIIRYFVAPATEAEKAQQDVLFRKILDESTTIHYWNSLTATLVPEPGSLISRLIDYPCIRCADVL